MIADNRGNRGEGRGVNPAEIQGYLEGLDYPADKRRIVDHARSHGANQEVVNRLEGLSERSYNSPTDLSQEISQME